MFSFDLAWHPFSVNLDTIDQFLRATYADYVGNSADHDLTLWFSDKPSDYELAAIRAYWDGLTASSPEARNYVPRQRVLDTIAALKSGMVTKDWNLMTATERKLALSLPVSNSDLGL